MSAKTKINWADATWNPVSGCSHASDGCRSCYAESIERRFSQKWYGEKWLPWTKENAAHNVRLHFDRLSQPLHWTKPKRIFVCSMGDLFHDEVPWDFINRVFAIMAMASQHTFLVLTKRQRKMLGYLLGPDVHNNVELYAEKMKPSTGPFSPKYAFSWPLPNVWLGVTAENQATADERTPLLLQTPAARRFVSAEPLLGPIRIDAIEWLDMVIVGGESGPKARPMNPDWVRSIRDQCQAADTPFFFKGWGAWAPNCLCDTREAHRTIERPEGNRGVMFRCGKKATGRELDGRIWNEVPK